MSELSPSDRLRQFLGQSIPDLVKSGIASEVASGLKWAEGPAWLQSSRRWIFSDIPENRVHAYSHERGLSVFQSPSYFANGHTPLRGGEFLACEHLTRSVTRINEDGLRTVLCNSFEGRKLNSPNDIVVRSDGSIWFTDPTYGILTDIEGKRAPSEQQYNNVYRYDEIAGTLTAEIWSLKMPNGLCFSPNESVLYVADSGADMGPEIGFNPFGSREVVAFNIGATGQVRGYGTVFCRIEDGVPDGLRCDEQGYLWVATGAGIECYSPKGTRVGILATPEAAANLSFGGPDGRELMIAATSSVFLLRL